MDFVKLKKLCVAIIDCPHSTPHWKTEGIRVIRNFNLKNGSLDFSDGYYVDEETYKDRTKRATPEEGDIVISREAPMGVVAMIPKGLKCCLGQRLVLLKIDKNKVNKDYLLFILMSDFVQKQFRRADTTGSIVSNLCIPDLEDIIIPVIKAGQERIARLLSNINKRIILNTKINDNLYQMAMTEYMHMFFNKKANSKFGNLIVEQPKSTIQVNQAQVSAGTIPFFTSGDAILTWPTPLVSGRNIFLNTGGNADVKFYIGDSAYSTDTWCITAKDDLTDYLYLFLQSIKLELNLKFFLGTGLKHLQKPMLKDRPIYLPSTVELKQFNDDVKPFMSMISDNVRETKALTSLRDWLLPMLMNGQATITD